MRELEFLPEWYGRVRRRKRAVLFEIWAAALLVAAGAGWAAMSRQELRGRERALAAIDGQLNQSITRQHMLAKKLSLRKELRQREQVIASLGYPIDTTRVLQTLDRLMPKEMSLTDFSYATSQEAVAVVGASKDAAKKVDRKLRVRIVGVAPSDVDLANFLTGLTSVPFFDQVALTYTHPKTDEGHLMREFEVTFCIDLNQAEGASRDG